MDKLDFKTFDERFQNVPVKVGSEQSEIDNLRDEFIAKNSLTYLPRPAVPAEIKGEFCGNPRFVFANFQGSLPTLADSQPLETGTGE